jgi:hypothetical protein
MHHGQGHCQGGESTCQARVWVFTSKQILVTLSALPDNTVDSLFVLVQWIHSVRSPCDQRNTRLVLNCEQDLRAFHGRGELYVFHCMLWRFVSGSYWKHHVSSLVMTLSNISALCKRSDEVWRGCCFWSSVVIFLIPKSSVIICHTVSLFIFNSSAINLTPDLQSEHTGLYSVHICICPMHFSPSTSWVSLHIFLRFLEPPMPFKNIQLLHSMFTISHC